MKPGDAGVTVNGGAKIAAAVQAEQPQQRTVTRGLPRCCASWNDHRAWARNHARDRAAR
jgi:hypothetical protein